MVQFCSGVLDRCDRERRHRNIFVQLASDHLARVCSCGRSRGCRLELCRDLRLHLEKVMMRDEGMTDVSSYEAYLNFGNTEY